MPAAAPAPTLEQDEAHPAVFDGGPPQRADARPSLVDCLRATSEQMPPPTELRGEKIVVTWEQKVRAPVVLSPGAVRAGSTPTPIPTAGFPPGPIPSGNWSVDISDGTARIRIPLGRVEGRGSLDSGEPSLGPMTTEALKGAPIASMLVIRIGRYPYSQELNTFALIRERTQAWLVRRHFHVKPHVGEEAPKGLRPLECETGRDTKDPVIALAHFNVREDANISSSAWKPPAKQLSDGGSW